MMSVMVPPLVTVVAGVNTRMGVTVAPDTWVPRVMDVKMIPVMATLSTPVVGVVSALVESWKPPVTAARAPPRVSPVRVIVTEATVPISAPAVVRTIDVLEAVAAGVEVAVNDVTLLVMEATVPKK